jgi:hypothetical protein
MLISRNNKENSMEVPASHKETSEKLLPIGAGVARSLALGLDLEDIAVQYSLPMEQISKIARGNLVKKRVQELTVAMDKQFLEDAAENPVIAFAKGKGLATIQQVAVEVENQDKEEGGATASTRLQAAKLMLEVGGNLSKEKETSAQPIIMISADKVNLGRTIINNIVESCPDYVDG